MSLPFFVFSSIFVFISTTISISFSSPYPYGLSYHIDCGSPTNTSDPFNTTWLSDRFFTGGVSSVVSEPLRFNYPYEKTLRFFPVSHGKKNCYVIPTLPSGRYFLRAFVVYDNYDGKSHAPSFDVAVEGTVVFSWRSPWLESVALGGAYSDLFVYVPDGEADVCFYSLATDPPVISSLELEQVDSLSYDSTSIGNTHVLVNYGRLSCGAEQWGPGFSNDTDLFGRSWQSDSEFRSNFGESSHRNRDGVRALFTRNTIRGTEQKPNYFPMKLYQSAVTVGGEDGVLEYNLNVDAKLDYLVWLHFAEIDSTVKKAGDRVFDVFINDKNVTRIDIYKQVGTFAAFTWHYTVRNLSSSVLTVKLVAAVGAPLISGLENYALIPSDPSTVPQQAIAMKALKESLRVPDRMGWNGDPCAPTNWDAWEGVTCRMDKNHAFLVISDIDLGSQGLKGDLSKNELTGSIPDSLASSSLQLVLLNDNFLEGQVPEGLYSIGVHGGAFDLSSNKGLCGVPSLPACPLLWKNGRLSTWGKVAIGLSCLFVFCAVLVLVYIYVGRRRNEYDFGLPHELMSLAGKRSRYQRHKSLMHLEMESQHARGLSSPYTLQ